MTSPQLDPLVQALHLPLPTEPGWVIDLVISVDGSIEVLERFVRLADDAVVGPECWLSLTDRQLYELQNGFGWYAVAFAATGRLMADGPVIQFLAGLLG